MIIATEIHGKLEAHELLKSAFLPASSELHSNPVKCASRSRRLITRAQSATRVIRNTRFKAPRMIVDAVPVEKGKYGYHIESCINSLNMVAPRASMTHCMDLFKNKLNMQDFACIFREFAQRNDWNRAYRLFKYMQRQQWCKPTEHIYTILIGILGREGLLDKCTEVFEDMPQNEVRWNVYVFTALINAYGRNGLYEESLQLLTRIKQENIEPNLITYNTVINSCVKGGLEWDGLLNLFAQMRHEGIQPDVMTYNTLLSACADRGLVDEAGVILRSMNDSGTLLNSQTYRSLVETFAIAGKLEGMEQHLRNMELQGNAPDVVGYNTLMEAYASKGDVERAAAVFKGMQKAGCSPDVKTYSILLHLYGRRGSFEQVKSLFTDMKYLDKPPDLPTYNMLIEVFGEGGYWSEAVSLFDEMVNAGVEPSQETYAAVLAVCGRGALIQDAARIHKQMLKSENPNFEASAGLISAYGKSARYQDALLSFNLINKAGCTPQASARDALMEGYAKGGLYIEATFEIEDMIKAGISPNVQTLNWVIEACSRAGAYTRAFKFLQEIHRTKQRPNSGTYLTLLGTYCAMGSLDEAKAQFLEMKEVIKVPDASAYSLLLSMCARRNNWDYAAQLVKEMQGRTMPELHTLVAGILTGRFNEDHNWQMIEHALDQLKVEDLSETMTFYNALIDALVQFNQRARAAKVLSEALKRGLFPEAFKSTGKVSSLDIHRMSCGAAVTALSIWFLDLASSIETLPALTSIVLASCTMEEGRKVEEIPAANAVLSYIKQSHAPFKTPAWNEGRLFCKSTILKPWLLSNTHHLTNEPLQPKVLQTAT